jgi:hypothetical protein
MLPDDFEEIELGMSNFDHEIDSSFEKAIKGKLTFGLHAGWNFNGKVYFLENQFHEDVWCHRVYRETVSTDSLRQLMKEVNDKYGWA